MKKNLTLFILLMTSFSFGQTTIIKNSMSPGGNIVSQGNVTILYAIGEIAVQETDAGTVHLSEGFIGPDMAELLDIENYNQLDGIKVYPNPVQDNLNINFSEYNNYEIHLIDLNGKELLTFNIEDKIAPQLDLSLLKTGIYIMSIIDRTHKKALILKIKKL